MSQIIIDTGNVANDGTGSTLRQAFVDVNSMFTEVYNAGPVSSNVSIANNTIATTLLNSNLILAPSGIGNVQANSRIVPGFNDVYDIGSPDKRWNTIYVGTGGLDIQGGLNFGGNVSANYFIGNGSQLTGIVAESSNQIANGTSNVNISTANGAVTVSINGTDNVAAFTQAAFYTETDIVANGAVSASGNLIGNYILGNGAFLSGIPGGTRIANGTSNVAITTSGGNVTVSVGGVDDVALFTPTDIQLKGDLDILGTIVAPGLAFESGNLALIGNVTAQYFIGNGSLLTGISSDISKKIANGTSNVNIATASGNVTVGVGGIANITTITTGGINVTGQISATGNIAGGYFVGNGRQLTGITSGSRIASGNSNVVVESTNGDVTIGVDGVSNVAVFTPTDIQLKGDLDILGTIVAPGLAFESGNLALIGNVTAQYFIGNGRFLTGVAARQMVNGTSNVDIAIANGNVTISVGGVPNVATFTTSGQNLLGSLSVSGTVTANTFIGNISGNIQAPGSNTQVLFNDNNTTNAVSGFTFNKTSNAVSISGNVTATYFTGNGVGLTSTLVDQGNDPNNWNTNLKMGVYTVNRNSWAGTTGAPLDSQVFVGLLEVTNSTNMSASQVFYPGAVTAGDVMIQWNRNYFNGVWTGWVKIINDDQIVHGGDF